MTINGMFRALIQGINIFLPPPLSFIHRKLAHVDALMRRDQNRHSETRGITPQLEDEPLMLSISKTL